MAENANVNAKTRRVRPKSRLGYLLPPSIIMHRTPSNRSHLSSTNTVIDQSQSAPRNISLNDDERSRQNSLIAFILDGAPIKGTLISCSLWYATYLQTQLTNQWPLFKASLENLDEDSAYPKPGELVVAFEFLLTIAKLLKTQKNLTLVDLVDELDNSCMLRAQQDEERAAPNQLAFAAVGWLTMLYEAVPHPEPGRLEVTATSTSLSGMRSALVTRKYHTYRLGFDYIDFPLYNLIGRFGDLIPEVRNFNIYEPPSIRADESESINVSSVCFQALHEFAALNIEWVTSLALHLELDSSRKTLKVFQFPSFCRLMTVERKNNILSRLLNDHASRLSEDVTEPDIPTDRLFEELLRTYRLIFQHPKSRAIFKQIMPTFSEHPPSDGYAWDHDPLIRTLCTRDDAEGARLFEELGCTQTAPYYHPREFPFFGSRLLYLQQLVNDQPPPNLGSLWRDRRNLPAWWQLQTNHILIVFATVTIFLMVFGSAMQIWQVILAKQQLEQGRN